MLLNIGNEKFAIHFAHLEYKWTAATDVTVSRFCTTCAIHQGACKVKGCAADKHPYFGSASCHPGDQFNKRIGRKLAMARALKPLPRNLRQQIWAEYFKLSPHE